MAVHEILKMGDPRLLRVAQPVTEFGTPALKALIADMFETMAAANGAGLARIRMKRRFPACAVRLPVIRDPTDGARWRPVRET